jgi:hypothetical protein
MLSLAGSRRVPPPIVAAVQSGGRPAITNPWPAPAAWGRRLRHKRTGSTALMSMATPSMGGAVVEQVMRRIDEGHMGEGLGKIPQKAL